jgi:hypothetical protein
VVRRSFVLLSGRNVNVVRRCPTIVPTLVTPQPLTKQEFGPHVGPALAAQTRFWYFDGLGPTSEHHDTRAVWLCSSPSDSSMPKRILASGILGQQGINLVERIVLKMGFLWHPTGGLEAGTDGFVEIRDAASGEVTNSVLQVQSRAFTGAFTAETEHTFEYLCGQKDLDYWLSGNVPFILVVSRPGREEAYWVSIKDYFKDPSLRKSRRIVFDKHTDRFTAECSARLIEIAVPRDAGLYFEPAPAQEKLYSNLLNVEHYAPSLWVASTDFRVRQEVFDEAKRLGVYLGSEWFFSSGQIFSFLDLREPPLDRFCDQGTVEQFDSEEWALSDDPERRKQLVRLLNLALKQKLYQLSMLYSSDLELYYFRATRNLRPRTISYRSLARGRPRTVFKAYPKAKDPKEIAYYRHSAFEGQFHRIEGKWYLEITPTYYFTSDGKQLHPFYEGYLTGIKRLEHNSAVLGQLLLFADHLTTPGDMYNPEYPLLRFGALATFDIGVSINDELWLPSEEEPIPGGPTLSEERLPLFHDED